ncbi:helix-turn-helix domain-containing protein [Streptomyces sp. AK04-3B]|uniref:ArsR/SmtB family transcription factor n=1 Tax=Streptomyces sp. AK04-3B TaxID=3028650 RepID=UPI0029B88FEB|nr:helix-turn-helix domain-containing protein [Streptomyces sp. AK04-3B]MDX3802219.1 helix-turn-helix domain-containing protein [Streptomyces sp. AK04-3B]
MKLLKDRDVGLAFRRWHVSVRGRLGEQAGPLGALMPSRGSLVDMASLTGDTPSIDEAVDNLLTASRSLMRLELENIDFHPAHRSWARKLVDGDREARLQVAAALRACHHVTVAPYWTRVRSRLSEVRAAYGATMADGGVEKLLTTLGASVRWQPPVLEVVHARDADIHLHGRGLVIAPTMFSTQQVEVLQAPLDPARAPVLAIPVVSDALLDTALWGDAGEPAVPPVNDLLGRTRAAVLRATADGRGCSTTQLARRLNLAPATASHHTTVLRNARLITTRREGKVVMHSITGLGLAVLEQKLPFA